jgi:hypothetical protein
VQPNPEHAPAHEDRQKTERAVDELRQSAQVYALDGSPYVEPRSSANTQSTSYSSGLLPSQIDEPPSTGDDMSGPTREEIKAEIGTAEARTDTKIARLEGKMDIVIIKLDAVNESTLAMRRDVKDSERAIKANAWVIFAALAAILIGLIATIPAIFDWGFKMREVIDKEIHVHQPPVNSPPPSIP